MANQNLITKAERLMFQKASGNAIETGIIMDNRSPMKNGAVKVWVDGSNYRMNDPNGWVTVEYAPSWYGCTPCTTANNTFEENPKSYGVNFPAVDIGTRIAFFRTQSGRNYYFCHIPSQNMQGMIPGIHYEEINGVNEPVTEYNKNLGETAKSVFKPLSDGLKKQGLDKDMLRGLSSASPKREIPSRAFGFLSTRGQQLVIDDGFIEGEIGDNWEKTPLVEKPTSKNNVANSTTPRQSEMIRLRTRSGAQILISETTGHIYLINKDGNVWVELNNSGNFDVWSSNGCTFRTNGTMNIRADQDINIEAGNNINLRAASGNITQNAGGSINYQCTTDYNISATKMQVTATNFDVSGIITSPMITTDKFTLGAASVPTKPDVPSPSSKQDYGDSTLDTIVTRLLYKEPCLVHDEVVEVTYTTENNNSLIIPEGSYTNTNVKTQVEAEATKQGYKEWRSNGIIHCQSVSGEYAEFDEKTEKRIK